MDDYLRCPDCGRYNTTVTEETTIMANTGRHYCYSVKACDGYARAGCLDCGWVGRRDQLKDESATKPKDI